MDIEYIKNIDCLDYQQILLSDYEYNVIKTLPKNQCTFYYYDLLTAKESYLKRIGKGFSIKLNSLTVKNNNKIYINGNKVPIANNFIKQLNYLFPHYRTSICCSHEVEPQVFTFYEDDIIDYFINIYL